MNDVNERLSLFRELVTCTHNLTFSAYNSKYENIFCNNDMAGALYIFLAIDELQTLEQLPSLNAIYPVDFNENPRPVICTNSLGMFWISECEFQNHILQKIHVVGPVFTTDYSLQNISKRIDELHLPFIMKKDFLQFVEALPVIPLVHMHEYGCMLHYCLYLEKISISDLRYQKKQDFSSPSETARDSLAPEQTYLATKNVLDMVENGNLEYQKSMNRLASMGYLVNDSDDFLRQSKNAMITLNALCCHAAIRGGLPPATAYLISDHYLQGIEDSTTISVLSELSKMMLPDYTQRVHRLKCLNSSISPGIQAVCDRIAMNPETVPDTCTLAESLGYSESYFSRKFHQETGVTVKDYILQEKTEKAKTLLKTTAMSISAISEKLGFCSLSYFGKQFKKLTGMSPGEYREQRSASS